MTLLLVVLTSDFMVGGGGKKPAGSIEHSAILHHWLFDNKA